MNIMAGGQAHWMNKWMAGNTATHSVRSTEMLLTLYGDTILPRRVRPWQGGLVRLMGSLGCAEQQVRTALFRHAKAGWFDVEQQSRRSYYALSEWGRKRLAWAAERVFAAPELDWSGNWQVVLAPSKLLAQEDRELLRRKIESIGFAQINPGLYVHPSEGGQGLQRYLKRTGLSARVMVLQARSIGEFVDLPERRLVREFWGIDALEKKYATLNRYLSCITRAIENGEGRDGERAFVLRSLMIYALKEVAIVDPQLPAVLLPENWVGNQARRACRDIYWELYEASEDFLSARLACQGDWNDVDEAVSGRFGGRGECSEDAVIERGKAPGWAVAA